jgi:hypothetical protein
MSSSALVYCDSRRVDAHGKPRKMFTLVMMLCSRTLASARPRRRLRLVGAVECGDCDPGVEISIASAKVEASSSR